MNKIKLNDEINYNYPSTKALLNCCEHYYFFFWNISKHYTIVFCAFFCVRLFDASRCTSLINDILKPIL